MCLAFCEHIKVTDSSSCKANRGEMLKVRLHLSITKSVAVRALTTSLITFIFLPSEVGDHVSCLVVARRQQFLA
jgi:hypothetical protein